MWRVTGFTIQVGGGGFYAAVAPPVNTAGYIADGLGCVEGFGMTCNPLVGTTLVDVVTNAWVTVASVGGAPTLLDYSIYSFADVYLIAEISPGRRFFKGEQAHWRALALAEIGLADPWPTLVSLID